MCSSKGKLYRSVIEDAELIVCENCSKFGKKNSAVIQDLPTKTKNRKGLKLESGPKPEIMEVVVQDFADKIRKKRESLNLNQKQFAIKISLKESLVHKIESGNITPPISLAKKIGRFLKIKLIEDYEDKPEKSNQTKTEKFTIGDFIKIKKD